jgi:hypothetical protein
VRGGTDFKGNTGKEGRVGDMVRELGELGEDVGQSNLVNRKRNKKVRNIDY